jgi:transcriptional regulator with XRE-family HTH domain
MKSANEFLDKLLDNPAVKREYDRLEPEFALVREMIAARKRARLTQDQVAERMGTTKSAVARLESAAHKPSLRSVERYAAAIGHKLEWRLVPDPASYALPPSGPVG